MRGFLLPSLLLMIFGGVFGVTEATDAQDLDLTEVIVSLELDKVSLKTALDEIEKQTDLTFAFSYNDIDSDRSVSLQAHNKSVEEILKQLFQTRWVSWALSGKTILFKRWTKPEQDDPNFAFDEPIEGQVTDAETGETLPGVNILVKGTSTGASTDQNGSFELTVPSLQDTLVVSFIGYQTLEVPLNERSTINIQLTPEAVMGEEMVVVGYGEQRKSDLTGAVGSVDAEDLQTQLTTNIDQALSGRIAGVDVSINSGRPGGSPQIRIRGSTSVSNTNDPLYVVDGVMLNVERLQEGTHAINSIDPASIESIEVLKDASSTAIYGARGANGVVLITTKKGSRDGGRISYNGSLGIGSASNRLDLMDAEEFLLVEDIAYQNAAKFDPEGFADGNYVNPEDKRSLYMVGNSQGNPILFDENLNPLYDTDWQDEAFQDAVTHNHSLSFVNGNEHDSYGLYLSYRDEDGIMKNSWLDRYSGRFVIDSQINPWLTVGGNINYSVQSERLLKHWAMRAVYQNIPIIPVKFEDGSWARGEVYPGVEGPNQRQVAEGDKHILNTQNTLGNVHSTIKFMEGLKLKTMLGTNIIRQETDRYSGRDVDWVSQTQGGIASISSSEIKSWQFENILTYTKDIKNKHSINALLGQSLQTSNLFSSRAESWGFLDDYFEYNNLSIGNNPRPPSSSASSYSMASFFGRVNYTLNNKYLFTGTGRVDGSSKFGNNNRYAFFPSLAFGWVVSEEDFLKDNSFISNLKLRTSYGLTGNSEISNYQYEAGLGEYTAISSGSRQTGIGIQTLANPDLKWETNTQVDFGLELAVLDDRMALEVDLYRRVSKDMLLDRPVPRTSGYTTVTENIGSMENKGIELSLTTYNVSRSDFFWSTTFNYTMNRNEVLKLHGGSDIFMGSVPGGTPGSVIREGTPVNTFLGYRRLGTWNTDEAEEAAVYNKLPGDIKYEDVNGDGAITSADWVPIGNGLPDGYGSLINTFSYKNFEMSIDVQFIYGNDVMWEITQVLEDRTGAYNNMSRTVLNAWTPENQDSPIAQMKPLAVGYDTNNDTHRLKDGSFIRGKNLTLSYNLPQKWVEPWSLRSLRIYASGQNIFTITSYPGYDPEVSTVSGNFSRGRGSFDDYPKARVFTLGVNIDF